MDIFYLVKGDTGSQIKVFLVDEETGEPLDCTNQTVRLNFRKKGSSVKLFTLPNLVTEAGSLAAGITIFSFENNLSNLSRGYYLGEIELIDNTSGDVRTVYETLPFTVRDEIG